MYFIQKLLKIDFFKVFASSSLSSLINFATALIITPAFIRFWQEENYGYWLYINSLVAFVPFFDLGLQTYAINKLQILKESKAAEFLEEKSRLLGLYVIVFLGSVLLAPIYMMVVYFSFSTPSVDITVHMALYLSLCLANLQGFFLSFFRVYREHHIGIAIKSLMIATRIILIFSLLVSGMKEVVLANSLLALNLLLTLCAFILLFKMQRLSFRFDSKLRYYISELKISSNFLFYQFAVYLKLHAPIIVLQYLIGPLAIITYTLHRTLINVLTQFISVVNLSLNQDISRNYALGNNRLLQAAFIFQLRSIVYLGFLGSFYLYIWYEPLLLLWLGDNGANYLEVNTLLLFLVASLISCIWHSGTIFLTATNQYVGMTKLVLLSSICFSVLSIPFTYIGGINGLLIALIISEVGIGLFFVQNHVISKLNIKRIVLIKYYVQVSLIGLIQLPLLVFFKEPVILSIALFISLTLMFYLSLDKGEIGNIKSFLSSDGST